MTEEALLLLTNMGAETSLRYALHMINAAALVASKRNVCTSHNCKVCTVPLLLLLY